MLKYSMFLVLVAFVVPSIVDGHGRLIDPPGRSTMWRYGFKTPRNFNDNELNCGGRARQWAPGADGKCGVCGDYYNGPFENEAGGKYAQGVIAATYVMGSTVDVIAEVTANHLGYFEYRLCKNDNPKKRITQDCLDKHLLKTVDGESRMKFGKGKGNFTHTIRLPPSLTCTQCVLQWKWNTGNSWGVDKVTGVGGLGKGPQEQFYGCADIAIVDSSSAKTDKPKTTPVVATQKPTPLATSQQPTEENSSEDDEGSKPDSGESATKPGSKVPSPKKPRYCLSKSESLRSEKWCNINCNENIPNCPREDCQCFSQQSKMISAKVRLLMKDIISKINIDKREQLSSDEPDDTSRYIAEILSND